MMIWEMRHTETWGARRRHAQPRHNINSWRIHKDGPALSKCLRADLALAGIADKDDAGRYVDFHGLRVSLSTMLAANKVSPRAAQALMRHTDPRLTASVYTDEKLLPLAAELMGVPMIRIAWRSASLHPRICPCLLTAYW